MTTRLRKVLRATLGVALALVLLFEEWGWAPLACAMARLARLPLWAWAERRIGSLPPWAALLTMAAPMVVLFPIKLLALYLFGLGYIGWGLCILVTAKLAGTALVARLFFLTLPALMRIGWFARWYPRWKNWKDGLLAKVRMSAEWQRFLRLRQHMRRWLDKLWRKLRRFG